MKKLILLTTTLLLLLGCETGVTNKSTTNRVNEPVQSGIIDRRNDSMEQYPNIIQKTNGTSAKRIFSNSAQPGYYLQMAVFEKNRPSKAFLKPLDNASFPYIVLNKYNKDYVLIGAYKSYNEAKNKMGSVKSKLGKKTFVVQVLRP